MANNSPYNNLNETSPQTTTITFNGKTVGDTFTPPVSAMIEAEVLRAKLLSLKDALKLQDALQKNGQLELAQWKHLANYDDLTKIYNRRGGMSALKEKKELCDLSNQGKISILFIDLDDFGIINKRHGDHIGDDALQTVAKTLQSCIRDTDICFRKGGDEFIIILSGEDMETTNQIVVDRLTKELDGNIEIYNDKAEIISIRGSIGIFEYQTQLSPEENIQLADAEMIKQKTRRKLTKMPITNPCNTPLTP